VGDGIAALISNPQQVASDGYGQWVAAGTSFACASSSSGGFDCWGDNNGHQTGDISSFAATFDLSHRNENLRSASLGRAHGCALMFDGGAACFGAGYSGEIGKLGITPATPTLYPPDHAGGWVSISAGNTFSCGVGDDATLYCWGIDDRNQLGL